MDLANKYRPKTLSGIVGQQHIVKTLSNAIQNNKFHHAHLFCGFFGCGKTSVARILSASLNCEVSPGLNPCGKCSICSGIFTGKHNDVEEIDAASGAGGVEEIRKIKQSALYRPVSGARYKTFLIDECQEISTAAGAALLKLLEEPPANVHFILCTTDPQKIKPTIQSRCQRHDFKSLPWSLMSDHLETICKLEKVECDKASLNLCARLANGSMRYAFQNLDKLIAFSGNNKITIEDAQVLFGHASELLYYDLIDQIICTQTDKVDSTEGFKVINGLIISGCDFAMIYDSVCENLRQIMVGLTCSTATQFISVSEEGKRRLSAQLKKCKEQQKLLSVIDSIKFLHECKKMVDMNIPVETALQTWLVQSIFAFRRGV